MRKFTLLAAALLTTSFTSSAHALSLEFVNKSKWDIHELYFSPADQKSWGPDQLGDDVIEHGDTFTLTKIARDVYDVKIVDEDGDSCEINDVDFKASEKFTLTEDILLGCQQNTDQGDDEE